MLVGDILHSCVNERVAEAAVLSIGGDFTERLRALAHRCDLSIGELVGRIDPTSHVRSVRLYDKGGSRIPRFVTSRNGELWFTEQADAALARFTISNHELHRYNLPAGYSTPLGIALGSDNQLWFTEQDQSPHDPAVGKICPSQPDGQCASGP